MPKYYVMKVTDDGLVRVEGKKWYKTLVEAEHSVKKHCSEFPKNEFMVLGTVAKYWLDPTPIILNDKDKCLGETT